ncbi:helix-turn-helix domain-containing protein [Amycolatopsis thermoflava]|uniref:helix-turn-helix domain-containing protein n=1 Tax=Amycolatopsis thermoflava TaxID=84480 RepID=UPI000404F4F7|nr:helix-turn-helix domain-containing protein [Amycolatopsis thermoflava]
MTEPSPDEFDIFAWERILLAARLPPTTKLVAFTLRTHADPDGTRVRPGLARLCVLTELSYATVRRARRQLVDVGLLALHKRGNRRLGKADEYRLILAEDVLERVEWLNPSQIDEAAEAIAAARAEAEAARRAKKQGSPSTPKPSDQDSHTTPGNPDQGSEATPDGSDQGSPASGKTAIRAHRKPPSGVASEPPPNQVTKPQNRPAPTHLPAQPQTAREKCPHGIRTGTRGDGTLACALCRREATREAS